MNVGSICVRKVSSASPHETIRDAARRMTRQSVGTLVVLDPRSEDEARAIGILTDRDIVIRCVAPGLDPGAPLSNVMSVPVQAVREDTPIEEALRIMSKRAIRRLVVNDEERRLVGILSLDDVIETLVEEVDAIGRLLMRRAPIPA